MFSDEDQRSRKLSRAGLSVASESRSRVALSIASDNRSKRSHAGASRSSMSSIFSKRASIAPNAGAADRLGPVKGRDIQVLLYRFLMPSFQRSVAVVPLPLRARTELLETSFRFSLPRRDGGLKKMNLRDQNADWLPAYGRTAKIGFDPICHGTAVTAQRQVETGNGNGTTEFFT